MHEYTLVSQLGGKQIDQLMELYRHEFWCNTRKRSDVEKMLANTDIILGVLDKAENLVGFARVLTDFVYKATLYDLIVHPHMRGKQLGIFLMNSILSHPKLVSVEHIDLNCLASMFPFYQRWGFSADAEILGQLMFMRRLHTQKNV